MIKSRVPQNLGPDVRECRQPPATGKIKKKHSTQPPEANSLTNLLPPPTSRRNEISSYSVDHRDHSNLAWGEEIEVPPDTSVATSVVSGLWAPRSPLDHLICSLFSSSFRHADLIFRVSLLQIPTPC